MKDTKKYDESRQLHKEGYLHENRVELKDNVEMHSISSMSDKGRNDVNEYGSENIKIKQAIVGWVNYFAIADMRNILKTLDEWLRRRIRMCYWKQWKKIKTKHDNLVNLGIENSKAWEYANTRKSYWRISNSPILSRALTNKYLKEIGLVSISEIYSSVH
ncbi:Group II intron, maturase-specific domain [Thermoanaerobacterium sp. RBIITD]|nr:group II intron maturase-specific domain-containing protein [Thermoanaerobacterium sp. RBIITD]SNX53238.1 Group II intron, maturase-specific domain [Thermoanaerobacterium sp. RBIITD]